MRIEKTGEKNMKVVIAIDSFKGSMSSIEAGEAAASRHSESIFGSQDQGLSAGRWRGRDSAGTGPGTWGKLGECGSYWTTWSPGCLRICNLGET